MVIAKVIAKQHLQHMTLFEGIFPQNDRDRERERERREKESERVGCRMIWYSNCRKQGTTG